MKAEEYPFVQESITDKQGQVLKVVLEFEEYQLHRKDIYRYFP